MKRSGSVKFPNSAQLFKFCQRVLMHQKNVRIRDQEIGSILDFNPSDCSHWKRGEKNVRSVFSLAKLGEALGIETTLIHDAAAGTVNIDEAFYEYIEAKTFRDVYQNIKQQPRALIDESRQRVVNFVEGVLKEVDFNTPPLYLPEVLRSFAHITTQPAEMIDKLSRVLRVKPGHYCIQFKKGDLKAQTRMSMIKDLGRIILEGERSRYPELGPLRSETILFEQVVFAAHMLLPRAMLREEMAKLDVRKNVVSDLAGLFWVPKSLVCFQLQDLFREGQRAAVGASNSLSREPLSQSQANL